MNYNFEQIHNLIRKYETRLSSKRQQLHLNPSDCIKGTIAALEEVLEDLKRIAQ